MPRVKRIRRQVPSISSGVREFHLDDYGAGMDNYTGNDKFPVRNGGTNKWRLAQNARIVTTGEYETRKGFDYHSESPATVAFSLVNVSTTGLANQAFDENNWIAQKITATATGLFLSAAINIKNSAGSTGTGTVLVELWTDAGNAPGTMISRTSIGASDITTTSQLITAYFPDAPTVTNGSIYWLVVSVQPSGRSGYSWSSSTTASTAKISGNSGETWTATSFYMNVRIFVVADEGQVIGLHRATKSNGTKVTLFAQKTSVYTVDETTGAVTPIKLGLSVNATSYNFLTVNDVVYYVNGYDGLRKWDFTTESQVNTTNYSNLVLHKGLLFGVRKDDQSRIDFSNFGDYETFTSTDFIYVPAPKTGDFIGSLTSINGYALIRTMSRAYILSGDDNASFRLDEAPDQKGTFSPETSCTDKNYEYFLSDDGVYRSNGTQPELISENIYESIRSLANKETCCMAVNRGRLYLWYKSAGSDYNDRCWVWNLNYKTTSDTVESNDTGAYVNRAISSYNDDNDLMVGSSRHGQIMWQERESNNYNNLGADIEFELRTHFFVGSTAAVYKQVRYWQPRFGAADDNYTCDCDYAYELRDNWQTYAAPDVQGVGSIWGNSAMTWGAFAWGASSEVSAQLFIPGEYKRVAVRYKHYATRQPQRFYGHSFRTQERRMR